MLESKNLKNKDNIYGSFEKEDSPKIIQNKDFLNNINIFDISLEDDYKNDIYLKNFISNQRIFEEEIEDDSENKKYSLEEINIIPENINEKNPINEETNRNNKNFIDEILHILRAPVIKKNTIFYNSPFKPLLKPKKISMEGKIIFNNLNVQN